MLLSPANTTVAVPRLTLTKSQSSASVAAGGNATYALGWTADGQSLQVFDSYDNASGLANGSIVGFDNTSYTYTNNGGVGGFSVQTDPTTGNNYIQGCAGVCNSATTTTNYPTLLRNGPSAGLCNNFTVEGDMEIPLTANDNSGADSTLVIADNLSAPGVIDAYRCSTSWG